MGDFWIIVKKEIKDLLRNKQIIFGMIILPLILFPALGQMMQIGIEQAQEETKVVLINFDKGEYGDLLVKSLKIAPNVTVTQIQARDLQEAIKKAEEKDYNIVVVIPEDFSQKIGSNEKTYVEVYTIFRGISAGMKEGISEGRINSVVQVLNEYLAKLKIEQNVQGDPEAILRPIEAKSYSIIKGRIVEVPPSVVSGIIFSQAFSIPLVLFIMITYVSQMAATTMAAEKENKTLETLLTLPVKRITIIAGKMIGTAGVALISSIAYMIGMKYYIGSLTPRTSEIGVSLEDLGLSITPKGAVLFALSLFLAIVFALTISMLLSVFAEDVRSATTLVSMSIMPLLLPSFILMFTDLETLPAAIKSILLALPFTHPILASRAMLMQQYSQMYFGIAYLSTITLITLYITAKFFSTEKVLTAKLKFGKRKKEKA